MQHLTGQQIRQQFLDFFAAKGHSVVPSSSVVPADDPTLLFTNAGMVQFKSVFLGAEQRSYTRAVSAQKCVRAGGKHNDLETVGHTARHQTFFEMLGNFSFGDYFKQEAIAYAWEFATDVLGLPPERLHPTVFRDDDEAHQLWQQVTGFPAERIVRLGEDDNFWQMGDTGPCGPCSELFYDMEPDGQGCGPDCGLGRCDCDRYREFWNLVFMQYNRLPDGTLEPLPRPSVDTGLGLERMAAILQGVQSNFDTDLLRPLITQTEQLSGMAYDAGPDGLSFRVIADHARCCAVMIADGIRPGNEGRGYVLRRILRRAVRYGKLLGFDGPFLHKLVPVVTATIGDAYPELVKEEAAIAAAIAGEEERFSRTLDQGLRRAEEILEAMQADGRTTMHGHEAFVLYDTYGFPLDLARDMAAERGYAVDEAGFEKEMTAQRDRARAARQTADKAGLGHVASLLGGFAPTQFAGYGATEATGTVLAVLLAGDDGYAAADRAESGDAVAVLLDATAFYAEGGGQIGDSGVLQGADAQVAVDDCRRVADRYFLHLGTVTEGVLAPGQTLSTVVDRDRRLNVQRHHTATHLLHAALHEVLGEGATQAGSLVAPTHLRFDFAHDRAVADNELRRIEDTINRHVLDNVAVTAEELTFDEARARGAMALFGEKYGERVRVVQIGDTSLELCGGTHVAATGEIGLVHVVSEAGIGSGLRRIEAVAGGAVLERLRERESLLTEAAIAVKAPPEQVVSRVLELQAQLRERERELAALAGKMAQQGVADLLAAVQDVAGVNVLAGEVAAADAEALRDAGDTAKAKLGSGVIVLAARHEDRLSFVAMVTDDLVARGVHAGKIVKQVAAVTGGGGGGRPDMAQAGGRDVAKLGEALASVPGVVAEMIG